MSQPIADPSREPTRILLVDDEESILYPMKEYFGAIGYEVDCARERIEAEALIEHVRYAALIVDLRLTVADGAEGLEIVRTARQRYPGVKVILLTAYGSPEIEQEVGRRGVDVFLHKPIPLPDVAKVMHGLLEQPA